MSIVPYQRRLQHGLVSRAQFSAWFTRGMDGATGKGELEICSTYLYRCEAGKVDPYCHSACFSFSKIDFFDSGCKNVGERNCQSSKKKKKSKEISVRKIFNLNYSRVVINSKGFCCSTGTWLNGTRASIFQFPL